MLYTSKARSQAKAYPYLLTLTSHKIIYSPKKLSLVHAAGNMEQVGGKEQKRLQKPICRPSPSRIRKKKVRVSLTLLQILRRNIKIRRTCSLEGKGRDFFLSTWARLTDRAVVFVKKRLGTCFLKLIASNNIVLDE